MKFHNGCINVSSGKRFLFCHMLDISAKLKSGSLKGTNQWHSNQPLPAFSSRWINCCIYIILYVSVTVTVLCHSMYTSLSVLKKKMMCFLWRAVDKAKPWKYEQKWKRQFLAISSMNQSSFIHLSARLSRHYSTRKQILEHK